MKLKQLQSKILLSTSIEQSVIFNRRYNQEQLSFKIGELLFLSEMKNKDLLKILIKQLENPILTSFGDYLSSEKLELFFKMIDNKIIIISAGEINKGLYKIFIEGIWLIR